MTAIARPKRPKVGKQSSNVSRVVNAGSRTNHMKMGVDYRVRAVSNAVAGHVRTLGATKAPRVKGHR